MNYTAKFNELYSEMYEPKLMPQDLLENLKLKNYISVNFSSQDEITFASTKCYLDNGDIAEYLYTFKELKLFRLENIFSDKPSIILYDRETEIIKLKEELNISTSYSSVS